MDSKLAILYCYQQGGDVYIKLARDIYKKAENDIEASERDVAKTICLGILYGMGPQQCSMRLVLSGYHEDDDDDDDGDGGGDDDDDDEYTNLCLSSLLPALSIHILLTFHLPAPSFLISLYIIVIDCPFHSKNVPS